MELQNIDPAVLEEVSLYIRAKYKEFSTSEKRLQKLADIKKARDAYKQKSLQKDWPWKNASNLIVPLTTISIDQLEPRLVASLIGRDEIIHIDDIGKLDKELIKKIASYDNAVLKNDVRLHEIIPEIVHTILIDGQVYLQPYWAYREVQTRQYVLDASGEPVPAEPGDPDAIMGYKTEEVVTTVMDGVKINVIPVETIFFPDRVDDWEEVPVIRKVWIPLKELRAHLAANDPGWVKLTEEEYDELAQRAYSKRPSDAYEGLTQEESREEKVPSASSIAQKLKAELYALEAHIAYDIDNDGREENLICIIEYTSGKILYLVNNNTIDPLNRKQIQPWYMIHDEGTAYGISIYEKVKEIERGSSVFFNMLVNSAIVQMIPWFMYEVGAGFGGETIELVPGKGHPVNDISKVFFPTINPTAAAFKDFVMLFMGLWERMVSISDYNVGRQSEISRTRSTATGTLALIQEAQILHEYMGTKLQQNFIKLICIIHDLYYLNATSDSMTEIVGEPVPRVLSKNYIFKLTSSTKSANRHVERQELAEALQVAEKGVQLGVVNPFPVVRDWLRTFKDVDVEEWMNTEVSQIILRLMQSQQNPQQYDPFPQIVSALSKMDPISLLRGMQGIQQVREGQNADQGTPGV